MNGDLSLELDPAALFALPNVAVLTAILLAAVAGVPALLARAALILRGTRPPADRALRSLTAVTGAATLAVWAVGAFAMYRDEEPVAAACAAAARAADADVVRYDTSVLPPRFDCVLDGGEVAGILVPGWVAPAFLALAAATFVLLAVLARRTVRDEAVARLSPR